MELNIPFSTFSYSNLRMTFIYLDCVLTLIFLDHRGKEIRRDAILYWEIRNDTFK